MKFSIITIAKDYPSEDLSKTLSSIFRQTNKDIQLILVISRLSDNFFDDLSNMLNSNHIDDFLIIANEDESLYDAMNIGLDNSLYQYCMFLNVFLILL